MPGSGRPQCVDSLVFVMAAARRQTVCCGAIVSAGVILVYSQRSDGDGWVGAMWMRSCDGGGSNLGTRER